MTRRDWLLLISITLVAAALRFYQLGVVPPGPQFDEAFNAIDAEQVLAGNRPLFLPANGGREVLYTYYQAVLGALLGLNLYTLRLASALAGVLTIPAVYLMVRRLFQRHSQLLAAFTALALALSYWHIHFSHYGIRIILMPLIFSGVFGLFWVGMASLAGSGQSPS
ncbi:MAG: glycosyltransferase family 39 protein [Caldilineaceae bacterium]|nr:glycosyltransferase family 39 protein [Caldilineaceae bacterium]